MSNPQFFGYGSLVNLATHDYPNARPAQLAGWRRVWRHAKARPVAFLSVEPHADTTIQGITANVPNADWAALDLREHEYRRRDVSQHFGQDTAVYEADPAKTTAPSPSHPILLSYLDVVIAGFQALHGTDGPARFFTTTTGWGPILDDRADPLYPRAQPLDHKTQHIVDTAVAALAVPVQPAKSAGLLHETIRNVRAPSGLDNP